MDLFDQQIIPLPLGDDRVSEIVFWPNWLEHKVADQLLETAIAATPWRKDVINIMGKQIPIPRLQNWFGDPSTSYTYSRIRLQAVAFPQWMEKLRMDVETETGKPFNRALVNYYRDGRDSVDWHADDEASLGFEPLIASVSVGAERIFQLRHNKTQERVKINLPHGSLLLMGAGVQEHWQHSVAKVKQLDDPRVNFTFRYMA
ncbi:MAG: alkylated DNA repair dioxygenase AlkB [Neolewinella sp.]|jgi:alkylated DNA repair dioxygenase AlkB|tara:strand:- start:266 stop:871 length:606 start_codon:yes stop_codon:yes gene_type:complete